MRSKRAKGCVLTVPLQSALHVAARSTGASSFSKCLVWDSSALGVTTRAQQVVLVVRQVVLLDLSIMVAHLDLAVARLDLSMVVVHLHPSMVVGLVAHPDLSMAVANLDLSMAVPHRPHMGVLLDQLMVVAKGIEHCDDRQVQCVADCGRSSFFQGL